MRTFNINLAGSLAGLLELPGVLSGQEPPVRRLLITLVSSIVLFLGSPKLAAQDTATPTSLRWRVAPPLLPPGAMIAVVSGDPAGPGQSTIQLSMPDGYRMPPHFHPADERVEVKQGSLLVGMGDRVSVQFIGLYTITYVNAYEAPRQASFPYGY